MKHEQINEGLKASYDAYNATLKPIEDWTVEGQRLVWAAGKPQEAGRP